MPCTVDQTQITLTHSLFSGGVVSSFFLDLDDFGGLLRSSSVRPKMVLETFHNCLLYDARAISKGKAYAAHDGRQASKHANQGQGRDEAGRQKRLG